MKRWLVVIVLLIGYWLGWSGRVDVNLLNQWWPIALPSPSPQILGNLIASSTSSATVVSRVIDGDTFELSDGQKVRYIGIDSPETKHPRKGIECFGQAASDYHRQLVEGRTVKLVKDVSDRDRYGRLLRYVYLDDQFLNEELVRNGYALSSSYPPDVAQQELLRQAEMEARLNKRGLWAACPNVSPTAPTN